ncbi:MAG: AEC family transporter [Pseudomonadota bacterium]|nr:AEC family transporter [Pseudomonadota bacterium]MEC8467326.1 AEC family transporter [Pseudomonadota bacterium]
MIKTKNNKNKANPMAFDLSSNLIQEIIPLYLISVLGFVAGRFLQIEAKPISTLTIYMLSPVVFFISLAQVNFSYDALLAPAITFTLACLLAPLLLKLFKLFSKEKTPYLLALTAGTNNWGYFGLPIAFFLFNEQQIAAYILIGFGFQVFENTLGVYYISRGHQSPLQSFVAIFKIPAIYAIVLGLGFSFLNLDLPQSADKVLQLFKGAYTVLGMMMIGLGLATLTKFRVDVPFTVAVTLTRFAIWPALAFAFIYFNQDIGLISDVYHKPLLLFSLMPMAANNIAFAAQFNMYPGKASVAVLITTLIALFYIPWAIGFLGI